MFRNLPDKWKSDSFIVEKEKCLLSDNGVDGKSLGHS
jgi:hypothetical protein